MAPYGGQFLEPDPKPVFSATANPFEQPAWYRHTKSHQCSRCFYPDPCELTATDSMFMGAAPWWHTRLSRIPTRPASPGLSEATSSTSEGDPFLDLLVRRDPLIRSVSEPTMSLSAPPPMLSLPPPGMMPPLVLYPRPPTWAYDWPSERPRSCPPVLSRWRTILCTLAHVSPHRPG